MSRKSHQRSQDAMGEELSKSIDSTEVRNIVVVSDSHCGCKLGLCPPGGIQLDDGGKYFIGNTQKFIWRHWQEFWNSWVPHVTKGEPYAVVHNGDVVEGVVKQSTTPISANLGDQAEIAYQCLAPIVDKCQGRYYQIRGTEAHVGRSGVEEERLAKRLGAIPNSEGQYARYDLNKRLGKGLINFAHHIGTTSSSQHESAAVNSELIRTYEESCRWGTSAPDIVVRSHRHRYIEVIIPIERSGRGKESLHRQRARSLITPGFQGLTPFQHRVNRCAPPQFGGVLIRWNDEILYTEVYCISLSRSKIC